jgi:O-acetyl-ADP-ribose deacetylase (regulator of RNase III)
MRWVIKKGNIIDEPADVLVCSANSSLNLSGGVAGNLLERFGAPMQKALHVYLEGQTSHFVKRGEVVPYSGPELPFKAILHAVAVDGFYQSTPETISQVVRQSLQMAAGQFAARKVTLTALATGYGNLTLAEFGGALRPLMAEEFPPVEEVCICLFEVDRINELAAVLPGAQVSI